MSDLDDASETDTSYTEELLLHLDWEVREDWFENILAKHYGDRVKMLQFEAKPEYAGEGALSSITSVKSKFYLRRRAAKYMLSVIIKRLPKDPFSRFFVTEGQFDLREIKFYTQVLPDLKSFKQRQLFKIESKDLDEKNIEREIQLWIPMCYHAHYIPASGTDDSPVLPESILVLDDARDNKDSEIVSFSEGLTRVQTQTALDTIASFHGHSLAMKIVDGQSLSERYPFLFQTAKATDSYQQLVERGLPQLVHFLESRPGLDAILETLLVLRPRTKDIISSLLAPDGPMALITHTDFWSNNLIFGRDSTKYYCHIVDWQMVTYSRPTNDVALLILSSVPTETRRKYIDQFLDIYWKKLNFTCFWLGVDIQKDLEYTREDFNKDYRRSQLLALLLCIGSVDVALGDPRTEQRLLDVLEDLYKDGVLTDEAIVGTNEGDS